MKQKSRFAILAIPMAICATAAGAVECVRVGCPSNYQGSPPVPIENCAKTGFACYAPLDGQFGETLDDYYVAPECATCNSGYNTAENPSYATNVTTLGGVSCTLGHPTPYRCTPIGDCDDASTCTSTSWTSPLGGYEVRTAKSYDGCKCNSTTEFRCAAGWYGSPSTVGTGCTRCPSDGGVTGDSPAGSTSSAACCVPGSDVPFSDENGSGIYSNSSCCYQ